MDNKEKPFILIADDNAEQLNLLTEWLAKLGYKTIGTTNGKDTINKVFDVVPDLILLDVHMPRPDGYEVCTILKKNPSTKDIPIFFISGLNDPYNKAKAFECGGLDYLCKPIQMYELKAKIEMQIDMCRKGFEVECFSEDIVNMEQQIIQLKKEVNAMAIEQNKKKPYADI